MSVSWCVLQVIAVVMEPNYKPREWVETATRGCSRLYLLNEDQYPAALMRLRWEAPLSSAEVRSPRVGRVFMCVHVSIRA